jgi:hypothetical protein
MVAGCNQKQKKAEADAPSAGNATAGGTDSAAPASPEDIAAEIAGGNYGRAADLARAATATRTADPQLYLLLARAEARLENRGYAVEALNRAFENGFHDPRGAVNHPDFDKIRKSPEFQRLLQQWSIGGARAATTRAASSAPSAVTRAGDVSITETGGHTRIRAGDIVIDE